MQTILFCVIVLALGLEIPNAGRISPRVMGRTKMLPMELVNGIPNMNPNMELGEAVQLKGSGHAKSGWYTDQ